MLNQAALNSNAIILLCPSPLSIKNYNLALAKDSMFSSLPVLIIQFAVLTIFCKNSFTFGKSLNYSDIKHIEVRINFRCLGYDHSTPLKVQDSISVECGSEQNLMTVNCEGEILFYYSPSFTNINEILCAGPG